MNLDIVIPYYNGQDTIVRLVQSIPSKINILIVDDVSTVKMPTLNYPNVKIIRLNRKGYFTGAVNEGIRQTSNDVLILNQDTYFTGDVWYNQLERYIKQDYHYIGERIKGDRPDWEHGYIHGTYMYISREAINKTGLLNESLHPMWGSTAEYQLRIARNNLKVMPLEYVHSFVHIRPDVERFGQSFKSIVTKDNIKLFTNTPPLVSVIIPVHGEKYAKFLQSTVNSLVGGPTDMGDWKQQTFASFEVVIVQDSSQDNTKQLVDAVCDSWKGVRALHLNRPRKDVWDSEKGKYIGKPSALNIGIKDAYGKYIVVLDADDMMHSTRLEHMFQVISREPKALVYDDVEIFSDGKVDRTWVMQDYDFDACLRKNQIHNSIMFSKDAWKAVGGYPERFKFGREDWAMNIRLGSHGYCGIHIKNYAGLLYRREQQNRTIENTRPEWMTFFQKEMYQEFESLYKGVKPKDCCGSKNIRHRRVETSHQGYITLEYVGSRTASFSIWGNVSKRVYRINPKQKFIEIDPADEKYFLECVEQNKHIFNRHISI